MPVEIPQEIWEKAIETYAGVNSVVVLIAIQEFATPPGSMPTQENIEGAQTKFNQEKSTILLTTHLQ